MKTRLKLVTTVSGFFILHSAFGQGALTPPGAPAPTMKSLTQIEPRTPISSLPYTISAPGSYYLTTNLTGVSGNNGITIASGDVTLDLAGFTVLGVSGSLSGILISSFRTNVTVGNGTVRGWGTVGVYVNGTQSRSLVFDHLNISGSGTYGLIAYGALISGCTVSGSGNDGIKAEGSIVHD